jgi:hypothetical protein
MSFVLECFAVSGQIVTFALCFVSVFITAITAIAAICKVVELVCESVADWIDNKEETK